MGEYDDRLALGDQIGERLLQGHHAEAGVDEQIHLLAAHVPRVRAQELVHVRLLDQRHRVIEAGDGVPPERRPAGRTDWSSLVSPGQRWAWLG